MILKKASIMCHRQIKDQCNVIIIHDIFRSIIVYEYKKVKVIANQRLVLHS